MSKPNLKDMMSRRTPLAQREAVTPVNMYGPQPEDQPTSGQVDKTTSQLVDKPGRQQVDKPTRPQVDKYTTHLRPETIKTIKRVALDTDRKDYEVVQQALDEYLKQWQPPES